ncbi:hypothetical protein [Methylobacterium iners]|uniref:ASCH domain-containing protein n=1 Tax=Methylobacterium iners TaxID=418707 RepID=A0ABQ4S794_9HYPH|nr:hypothetical protein [Methylobacterium iners]GJD97739.1 hypothetical protein OCOJLMKI_4972 [Methylobacterium iners]
MVAYSFKKQFVPSIRQGTKNQTIRAERKRHARPGERVQLYQGMRTRYCSLIAEPICEAVLPIIIELDAQIVMLDERIITDPDALDAFAVSDGFAEWSKLDAFWRRTHPGTSVFRGVLVRWTPLDPSERPLREAAGGGQMDLFEAGAEA